MHQRTDHEGKLKVAEGERTVFVQRHGDGILIRPVRDIIDIHEHEYTYTTTRDENDGLDEHKSGHSP
jgi:hypothetical protein